MYLHKVNEKTLTGNDGYYFFEESNKLVTRRVYDYYYIYRACVNNFYDTNYMYNLTKHLLFIYQKIVGSG